jgi:hypothetical protein
MNSQYNALFPDRLHVCLNGLMDFEKEGQNAFNKIVI